MAKKNKKMSKGLVAVLSFLALVGGAGGGCAYAYIASQSQGLPEYTYEIPKTEKVNNEKPSQIGEGFTVETIKQDDFSIHFMELGNKYTGDCVLVKAGKVEVLIDGGSKTDSINTIVDYVDDYIEDGLDYIIVTHAHEDHYAGYSTSDYDDSLFKKLNVNENTTVIKFAQKTKNKESNRMFTYFNNNLRESKANVKTCKDLVDNNENLIKLSEKVTMTVLKTEFYDKVSSTENNHSVCTLFTCDSLNYLLTGDLEAEGEKSLVEMNSLPEVELYKAGHHGSKTSSSKKLMETIKPKNVCVCCCAGSPEYTKTENNQFPTQEFIDNVAPYTDKIFVTSISEDDDFKAGKFASLNGNIVCSQKGGTLTINCTKDSTILKDTDWFKTHRTWPVNGK